MSDFSRKIIAYCEAGNGNEIIWQLKEMMSGERDFEGEIAWAFGYCFEKGFLSAFEAIPDFVIKYPNSLYPVMILYSDILVRRGLFDQASAESRVYLRKTLDSGLIEDLSGKPVIADGVSRAFLLLTSVYVEVGARSYAKRVLCNAKKYHLPEFWLELYKQNIDRLDFELNDEKNAILNDSWERFFAGGQDADFVYAILQKNGFKLLAKRIDLIESNFKYNKNWKCDESEQLKLVVQDQSGTIMFA